MKDLIIDMIGPVLVAVTLVELLSNWTGDEGLASAMGTLRIAAVTAILVYFAYYYRSVVATTDR